jgi:hypothetical protein
LKGMQAFPQAPVNLRWRAYRLEYDISVGRDKTRSRRSLLASITLYSTHRENQPHTFHTRPIMPSRLEARRPPRRYNESVRRQLRRRVGSARLRLHDPSLSAALQSLSIQPTGSLRRPQEASTHGLRKVRGHRRLRSLCTHHASLTGASGIVSSAVEGPQGAVDDSPDLPVSITSQDTGPGSSGQESPGQKSKADSTPVIGSGCSTASSSALGSYWKNQRLTIYAGPKSDSDVTSIEGPSSEQGSTATSTVFDFGSTTNSDAVPNTYMTEEPEFPTGENGPRKL